MITIKGNKAVQRKLNDISNKLGNLPKEAYEVFVKNTPVQKGNARRNTVLRNQQIQANYPYAKRLNEGYSKQAPNGMVEPTQNFVQERVSKIVKGS
jgi:galactokinase